MRKNRVCILPFCILKILIQYFLKLYLSRDFYLSLFLNFQYIFVTFNVNDYNLDNILSSSSASIFQNQNIVKKYSLFLFTQLNVSCEAVIQQPYVK